MSKSKVFQIHVPEKIREALNVVANETIFVVKESPEPNTLVITRKYCEHMIIEYIGKTFPYSKLDYNYLIACVPKKVLAKKLPIVYETSDTTSSLCFRLIKR